MKTLVLALVLAAFSALNVYAIEVYGYLGFFEAVLSSTAAVVVLTDLVISLTIVMLWMVGDARARQLPLWPYLGLTLVLGSVGVLSYLIHRELRGRALVSSAA